MPPIPAAVYFRMSTLAQEHSIDRQRSQVVPYAVKHGYQITREYIDQGIAGDEEEKRRGFMQMIDDAEHGAFEVIICDDKDRFSRFDSITSGYYVHRLRRAGVRLETVAQGRIDWSSFAGRITDAVLAEAKKLESQATSRRVMTRMLQAAQRGEWQGGVPPYGYDAIADDELGKKLVKGDKAKIEAVRLMFRLIGEQGYTLDQVVQELHARGYPPPEGPRRQLTRRQGFEREPVWQKTTVRCIVRNRKYLGDFVWNAGHDGKYSEVVKGQVQTSDGRIPQRENDLADQIVIPNVHEPLIDAKLFDKVQAKLAENRNLGTKYPHKSNYPLRGLVVCKNCGWRMIGSVQQGKRYYKCGQYHQSGRAACGANYIQEGRLLRAIIGKLKRVFLEPRAIKLLRAEVRRQLKEAEQGKPSKATLHARQEIKALNAKIDRATEQLALVDADLMSDVAAKIREWRTQRDILEQRLEVREAPPAKLDVDAMVDKAESYLTRLDLVVDKGEPPLVRTMLAELLDRIELHFTPKPCKGKIRDIFTAGAFFIRPQVQELGMFATMVRDQQLCNVESPIRGG
jgi:site-specific DNA recombinase